MKTNLSGAITLVVDTNIFLECSPLNQIPWDDLGFDEISLIVPRPVQQEIDNHKKGIKGRTFKKALAATASFREIVTGNGEPLVVRERSPRVTLSLMAQSKIDPTLSEDLDPSFNDDAIILRLLQHAQNNPSDDIRLLTHDTGPMATAQSVGVKFIPIPDGWLSNEHDDPSAKENARLLAEVKRLKSQEPVFSVSARDRAGNDTNRLEVVIDHYESLTPEDVSDLMTALQEECPLENDFGSAETTPQPSSLGTTGRTTVYEFQPAKQSDIEEYRDVQYPEWLENCRCFFESLHNKLNARVERPILSFEVCNTGTRPSTQSLVRFAAMGSIEILPEQDEGDADDVMTSPKTLCLSAPPRPPRGKWIKQSGSRASILDHMSRYSDPMAATRNFDPRLGLADLSSHFPKPRDPDAFYWRGGKPQSPTDLVELTCENWRHNISPEVFSFEVYPTTTGDVSAALKFEIHGENLTDPVQITVRVSFKQNLKSTLEKGRELVEAVNGLPFLRTAKGQG